MKRGRSSIAIISLTLIVAGILMVATGFSQLQEENAFLVAPVLIPLTDGAFQLHYNQQCIASVTTHVKHESSGTAISSDVRITKPDNSVVTINGELSFNDLGQLFGSVFQFLANGQSFKIGSTGIDPMTVHVTANLFNRPIAFTQDIPGPIRFNKTQSGYRLLYPKTKNSIGEHNQASGISLDAVPAAIDCPPVVIPPIAPEAVIKFIETLKQRIEAK